MSSWLGWVPVLASFAIGVQYLWAGEGSPVTKTIGATVFVTAAYLQFFSPYMVTGVLLQVALALTLEFWRRTL